MMYVKSFYLTRFKNGDPDINDINKAIEIVKKLRINNTNNILNAEYYANFIHQLGKINNCENV